MDPFLGGWHALDLLKGGMILLLNLKITFRRNPTAKLKETVCFEFALCC